MANYLPVLLISVSTNTIPDDNALTTIPCGQVDYLSHDWQEEDVWRSWRNMTRQKNEITNGIRLENASWRTWWKQRNKLKTISPETLNWLKDSDVTWLYGPLHTAVSWTPPPKPNPIPDSVDGAAPASTHDRLDLHSASPTAPRHSQPPRTKPILKHRSISELLTSDLLSPIFSPHESEDEASRQSHAFPFSASEASSSSNPPTGQKRPHLVHTKSDTHISRTGSSRALRKDSPPRVINKIPSHQSSSTVRASGTVRSSVSQDSASSASGSSERTAKKKHISFNTFVQQCIAIEKPKSIRTPRGASGVRSGHYGAYDGEVYGGSDDEAVDGDEPWNGGWDDDDGYEEDREDNLLEEDDPLWLAAHGGAHPRRRHLNGSAIHSDSDSDDGAIEIRPSSFRHSNLAVPPVKKRPPPRSQSASSSSSTTTTSASSSGPPPPPPRQRRKSASTTTHVPPSNLLSHPSTTTSAYRPRAIHTSSSDSQYRDRVTIAPIAPTFLKTTGAWEEGFGDDGGPSDDGLWDFTAPGHGVDGKYSNSIGRRSRKGVAENQQEEQSSDGTPVELVYVPPFGSIYGYSRGGQRQGRGGEGDEGEFEELEEVEAQVMSPTEDQDQEQTPRGTSPVPKRFQRNADPQTNIPIVVVEDGGDSSHPSSGGGNEAFKGSNREVVPEPPGPVLVPVPPKGRQPDDDSERERGRSLSVSPIGAGIVKPPPPASGGSGTLLSSRGRTQSCQDLPSLSNATTTASAPQGEERRGRLNTRAPSSSATWRSPNPSRSSQSHSGGRGGGSGSASPNNASASTSPMGSLSPDASDNRLGGIGSAYASGRTGGRERERTESSSNSTGRATGGSEERRGRDRGRRIIGPAAVSGSGSSSSPIAATNSPNDARSQRKESGRSSLSPQEVFEADLPVDVKGKGKELIVQQNRQAVTNANVASDAGCSTLDMDASICSVSSEGSTATIVPSRSLSAAEHFSLSMDVSLTHDDLYRQKELELERDATQEAEIRRKIMPTPSNSPRITMPAPQAAGLSIPTPPLISVAQTSGHTRSASTSSHSHPHSTPPSKLKLKPPPIVPSPPHPALPSTSPSHAPGEVGSPVKLSSGMDGINCRSASRSLERASSGSRERGPVATGSAHAGSGLRTEFTADMEREREWAEARRGRSAVDMNVGVNDILEEPTSPTLDGHPKEGTIINKAVGMVSSAGAYLRLWPNLGGT